MRHAQTNGQVQAANKVVNDGLKKRVDPLESNWAEKLENVLWPFEPHWRSRHVKHLSALSMSQSAIPVEIVVSTNRLRHFNTEVNNDERRHDLDMEDEKR